MTIPPRTHVAGGAQAPEWAVVGGDGPGDACFRLTKSSNSRIRGKVEQPPASLGRSFVCPGPLSRLILVRGIAHNGGHSDDGWRRPNGSLHRPSMRHLRIRALLGGRGIAGRLSDEAELRLHKAGGLLERDVGWLAAQRRRELRAKEEAARR